MKRFTFLLCGLLILFAPRAIAEEAEIEKSTDDNINTPDPAIASDNGEQANTEPSNSISFKEPIKGKHSWYRGSGEWIASRTVRDGLLGTASTKITTDGKRYDTNLGKRISLYTFDEDSLTRAWSVGFDGGMAVTLIRENGASDNVVFSTETFDGFFGLYVARALDEFIIMGRVAHISSHRVDNNPQILLAFPYSRFWLEIITGYTWPKLRVFSRWNVYLQTGVGFNFKAEPRPDGPRILFGFDVGYTLKGPNSVAAILSFDLRHVGVSNQATHYSSFIGVGRLKRPETTHRPWRIGISKVWGSDYRNQYFGNTDEHTHFLVQMEF